MSIHLYWHTYTYTSMKRHTHTHRHTQRAQRALHTLINCTFLPFVLTTTISKHCGWQLRQEFLPAPKPGCTLVHTRARSCSCGADGQTWVSLLASASFIPSRHDTLPVYSYHVVYAARMQNWECWSYAKVSKRCRHGRQTKSETQTKTASFAFCCIDHIRMS